MHPMKTFVKTLCVTGCVTAIVSSAAEINFPDKDQRATSVQTLNTPGNSSRNVALGPKAFQVNLSLVKRLAVTERSSLDLRFEAFNTFNNVNFGNPAATFGSSNFGQITSAGDARVVQTAIRYRF